MRGGLLGLCMEFGVGRLHIGVMVWAGMHVFGAYGRRDVLIWRKY